LASLKIENQPVGLQPPAHAVRSAQILFPDHTAESRQTIQEAGVHAARQEVEGQIRAALVKELKGHGGQYNIAEATEPDSQKRAWPVVGRPPGACAAARPIS
jgi:hypothetical protein